MLARFLPQSIPFFELIASQHAILQKQHLLIIQFIDQKEQIETSIEEARLVKDELSKLTNYITLHLSRTFITPIDKEDIHAISLAQEHLSDNLYHLNIKFFHCGIPKLPSSIFLLIKTLGIMLENLGEIIKELPKKTDFSALLQKVREKKEDGMNLLITGLVKIQQLEILDFKLVKDVYLVANYYEQLEFAIRQLTHLSDTLEKTMIKYV